jgi:hypothetical protein
MPPFEPPESLLTGFKERVEALSLQGIKTWSLVSFLRWLACDVGDRLYVGTANGNLSVYSVIETAGTYQTQSSGRRIWCQEQMERRTSLHISRPRKVW